MPLRHALPAVVLAIAALATPASLDAQSPGQEVQRLRLNTPVTSAFMKAVFADQFHGYDFVGTAGTTIRVTARWVEKKHEQAELSVAFGGTWDEKPTQAPGSLTSDGNTVTATRTFTEGVPIKIFVVTNPPGFTSSYEVTVTEVKAPQVTGPKSKTSGIHLAGGWNTTTFENQFASETGQGQGGRVGLGFGPLLLYGELNASEMEHESGAAEDAYTMTHREVGARLYLFGEGRRIRPFGQYAYGFRRLESATSGVQAEGISMTPGAGIAVFLLKQLSVEGAWTQSTGDIDKVRASSGDEWMDMPEEFILRGPGTKITVQMVLHL